MLGFPSSKFYNIILGRTKMKICLLTSTFLPKVGGAEEVVYSIGKHLALKGHEPIVITQIPRKLSYNDSGYQFEVIRYKRPWSFSLSIGMNSIRKVLEDTHEKRKFDIIHAHMVYPTGFIGMEFARKHNIPVIVTPHGSDIRETSRYRKRKLIWKRIIKTIEGVDGITAISDYMKNLIEDISPNHAKIFPISNGISFSEFAQKTPFNPNWPIREDERYIFYIGGLKYRKGVDILIEAMRIIRDKNKCNFSLLIAGEGAEKENLKKMVKEYELSNIIKFIGVVRGEFKVYLLQNALVQVIPSRLEPMGIVALEGLAAGVPIVASNVGGLRDIIKDNETGFLVPPENPHLLAEKIIEVIANRKENIISAGQELAKSFDWSFITNKYIEVYLKTIKEMKDTF